MRRLGYALMAALVFTGALVSCTIAAVVTILGISNAEFSITVAGIEQVPPLAVILVFGAMGALGLILAASWAKECLK